VSLKLQQNLQVWHLIVGLSVTIIGGAVTATAAFAGVQYDLEQAKRNILSLEAAKEQLMKSSGRTERNIVRIGSKLGIDGLESPE